MKKISKQKVQMLLWEITRLASHDVFFGKHIDTTFFYDTENRGWIFRIRGSNDYLKHKGILKIKQ